MVARVVGVGKAFAELASRRLFLHAHHAHAVADENVIDRRSEIGRDVRVRGLGIGGNRWERRVHLSIHVARLHAVEIAADDDSNLVHPVRRSLAICSKSSAFFDQFLRLREFYVGELHAEDRELVPHASDGEKASDDFMQQLREFSAPWRYDPATVVHKSF